MKSCEVCGITTGKIYGISGKYKRNLCHKHYNQINAHGKILDRTIKTPNKFTVTGDIVEVTLYNINNIEIGLCLVNTKHYDVISKYKWGMSKGYAISTIDGKITQMHRLITNAPQDMQVDHKDHNTLNNLDSNLRICTQQQNLCNLVLNSRNTSGHKGVSWNKKRNMWEAKICYKYKQNHLGFFVNLKDAIAARKEAEVKYHGKFAYTG